MAKIGRNDPCPCGSGRKFKKCCLNNLGAGAQAGAVARGGQPSIKNEIDRLQLDAAAGKNLVRTLGVFILLSTASGDGWLLEITEMDAVQVASGGEKIAVSVEEGPETIEINWTHKFDIKDKKLVFTSYENNSKIIPDDYPVHSVHAAVKKIQEKIPPELLSSIHISEEPAPASPDSGR